MSVKLMARVWELQLRTGQRDILLVMADHADDDGNTWPRIPLIAWKTDSSQRTVKRQLASIVEDGLAVVTDEGGGRNPDGSGRPRKYRLTLDNGVKKPPMKGAKSPRLGRVTSAGGNGVKSNNNGDTTPPSASEEPPSEPPSGTTTEKTVADANADDIRLCNLLADLIAADGSKRPTVTVRWTEACRLMRERDGRSVQGIEDAIRWSQAHSFWRTVVLSMPKLREKFDQMRKQKLAGDRRAGALTNNPDDYGDDRVR